MNLIVAVDQNLGIGCDGQLLFHIPEDMRFFRSMTEGKIVVMGRKTLQSLPSGNPLPNRTNIVLTADPAFSVPGVLCCHSYGELESCLAHFPPEDVFLIGGASLYQALYDCCSYAYITRIESVRPADAAFPDLFSQPNWHLTGQSEWKHHKGLSFRFCTYHNKIPAPMPAD